MNRALAPQPANIIAGRSSRNAAVANAFDALAKSRSDWRARNSYYYACDLAYTRFLVPEGLEVVEIGCGSGALLAGLHPRRGVGVDISGEMIAIAKTDYPSLEFVQADAEAPGALDQLGVFDVVLISDTVGMLEDIASFFRKLKPLLKSETRIIVAYYSRLWEPLLQLATRLGMRMPTPEQSWLSTKDIMGMMEYGDLEPLHRDWRILLPRSLLGVGAFINKYIAPLPGIRRLCLRNYVVARPAPPQSQPVAPPLVQRSRAVPQ